MDKLVLEALILLLVEQNSERSPALADAIDEMIARLRQALAAPEAR